ncbi:Protein trichome birefringence-like 38 [Camellia lanceoleosa]|uniref:Protein trichome birefringence-like 38 n=1 Tax=Camellia lanceoleosa TaxID=1840588 RepID=A0ACC0H745_9ERIC|nr:Protein trichome birefringence-like 38 [Camellia lanceoleosa]
MAILVTCSFSALLVVLLQQQLLGKCKFECDYFKGSWVKDSSYPLFNSKKCPFIENDFNCLKNGRPDLSYLKYKWQPCGSHLPRWDYIQLGNPIVNDMNRLYAMEQALIAWGRWVDSNVVSNKTRVFFQGVSPIPYNGSEWKEPKVNSCKGQMKLVSGSTYPRKLPPAMAVMKEVLRGIGMPVLLQL